MRPRVSGARGFLIQITCISGFAELQKASLNFANLRPEGPEIRKALPVDPRRHYLEGQNPASLGLIAQDYVFFFFGGGGLQVKLVQPASRHINTKGPDKAPYMKWSRRRLESMPLKALKPCFLVTSETLSPKPLT